MPKRVKIESLTEDHGPQYLEESFPGEGLATENVYVDPKTGRTYDGHDGRKVRDLPDGAVEVPRTTWF